MTTTLTSSVGLLEENLKTWHWKMIKDGIVLTASKAVSGSDKAFVYQY